MRYGPENIPNPPSLRIPEGPVTSDEVQSAWPRTPPNGQGDVKDELPDESPGDDLQAILNNPRPKVLLSSANRLMSDVAGELGGYLKDKLYLYNNEVVIPHGSELRLVSAQEFRTLVEQHGICCKKRSLVTARRTVKFDATMGVEESRGILASLQFRALLRPLRRINTCRLPVVRMDGSIELLPEGYDAKTETLTVSEVEYQDDIPLTEAVALFKDDLYSEFEFADGERSLAVAIAAGMGLFAAQIIPKDQLRPCFAIMKNAEGAGAGTLVACATVPVVGDIKTGVKPSDEAEMRKTLTTAVCEGRQVLLLDNVKGRLDSPALEAFLSSTNWSDRHLGFNETISGPNLITVFATGNGMTISSDMRRRSLVIELHQAYERPEDRVFKKQLNDAVLKARRFEILAAYWSMVRNWDDKGRPLPSRSHSGFRGWAEVIGGIVEAAGFACPLTTANVAIVADEDGDAMRVLVEAMIPAQKYIFAQITGICRDLGVFPSFVGDSEAAMETKHYSAMGWMLNRYDNRFVGERRFRIEGRGHAKRFWVEDL
jgi:hypothetical protein